MSRPALGPTQRPIHAEGLKIMCVQTIFKDTDNKKLCSLIFTILERGATIEKRLPSSCLFHVNLQGLIIADNTLKT
jgi:hypothetical protein